MRGQRLGRKGRRWDRRGHSGILLGLAGFNGDLAVQPASVITMICLLFSLIPSAMYILVYLSFRMYTLDS